MRTTLTLEPDVAMKLKKRMAERNLTLKDAVNQTLRSGFKATENEKKVKFKVEARSLGLKPGIDPNKLNQLLDQLDVEEFIRKMNK